MSSRIRLAVTALAGVIIAAVIAWPVIAFRDRLPDPMASHWDLHGRADGSASPTRFAVITVVVWLVICVLAGANAIRSTWQMRRVRSTFFMVWGFVAGVLITLQWTAVWANLDRSDWTQARSITWAGAGIDIAGGIVLGALGVLIGRFGPDTPLPSSPELPSLDLKSGERTVWVATARNHTVNMVGSGLVAVGAVVMALIATILPTEHVVPYGVVPFVVGLLLLLWARVRVTVDEGGVGIALGLGWPRWNIPLADITGAWAENREAMAYGGWGYRGFSRGAPVVMVRSGVCLVVERGNGRTFAVSVDDAANGAALLNSLRSAIAA
jgi:Protein of unknown function (DUF1648)